MNALFAGLISVGTVSLGILAQYYRVRAQILAQEVLNAHDWVDQIIEVLEAPEDAASERRLAGLVDSGRHHDFPGSP